MNKKQERLNLHFDYAKSGLYSFLALTMGALIGYEKLVAVTSLATANFMLICFTLAIITMAALTTFYFYKLDLSYEDNKEKMKKDNWFRRTFSFDRFIKAFLMAVGIGLGAYLGKLFYQIHWALALLFVTLFLMIFMGKYLDAMFGG